MSDAAKDAEDKARFSAMEIEGPMKLQLIEMDTDTVMMAIFTGEKCTDEKNPDGTENNRFIFNVSRENFDSDFPPKLKETKDFADGFLAGLKHKES